MSSKSLLHTDGWVQVNGLNLHYEQWGEGPDVVIGLHGTSLHGRVWQWLVDQLPAGIRFIGLDQRAHGDSDAAPAGNYFVGDYVGDLEAFVDRLGLERFSIVGSSLGSRVGLLYAARHPERVHSLGLLDLSFEMPTEASEEMVHAHITRPREFDSFESAVAFSKTLPQRLRFSDATHRLTLQGDLRERADGKWEWRYNRDAAIETLRCAASDMWESVRAVRTPTTILRGEHSNVLIASTVERLKRELAGVQIIDVPGAGHSIWGDNPTFTASAIAEAIKGPVVHAQAPLEPVAPPLSKKVEAGGISLHYLQWGASDAPAILCLHGTSMQATAWTAFGEALQDKWRVIAVDMRGHGQSEKPATGYELTNYADDVVAFMDALGIANAHLAGSSVGSQVAIDIAARYPQRVGTLVLSDPSCTISQEAIDGYVQLHQSRPRTFSDFDEVLAFSRQLLQRQGFTEAVHRFTAEGDVELNKDGRFEWRYGLDPILQTFQGLLADQTASIAAVRAAVLILRASRSHVLERPAAEKLRTAFTGADLIQVANSSHTIWGDRPDVLAREARAFLQFNEC